VRIDFENTEMSDVGVIEFFYNSVFWEKRYWMINASIGIIADANKFFNHQSIMWDFFKRYFVNGAILFSALKTITRYKNKDCRLSSSDFSKNNAMISNFGIAKNPNFAGDFSYPGTYSPANGLFSLYLLENKSLKETLFTLRKLWKKKLNNFMQSGKTDLIEISSDVQFNVEFDGEVITTDTARFSIVNKAIKICK
jgi:diacylglycerol kinase family enzyme